MVCKIRWSGASCVRDMQPLTMLSMCHDSHVMNAIDVGIPMNMHFPTGQFFY